jgi:hypothetical protein
MRISQIVIERPAAAMWGERNLLQNLKAVPLQGGELDVDTIEDLDRARKLYSA